ncbi:uroporphyrinogen-III synthase [Fervidibacillus albus]|uniref:Uroporphyrinogen-III synthase n=1 Tax=Fervidibacillus albus TaxID=2980026 RepID=A0A9E8RVZ8_9BACI|nr:uroporphyrinogen-III synthase [Fervidibacillus albus]WAA11205.1 uroporphyrinogen-III synthase [Fervidibacillus albus]
MKKGLEGKKCLIMRHPSQAKSLIARLKQYGADPFLVPLITFRKSELTEKERRIIRQLPNYHWIVFTSQNGVKYFLEQMTAFFDLFPQQVKVAAVGKKTAEYLHERGIKVDFIPEQFTGETLSEEMKSLVQPGENICVIKGNLAKSSMREKLKKLGARVDEIVSYETQFPKENHRLLMEQLGQSEEGVLIFTSPSQVDHFWNILSTYGQRDRIQGKWIAAIGPVTKHALEARGIDVHICPDEYTAESLVEAIYLFFNGTKS